MRLISETKYDTVEYDVLIEKYNSPSTGNEKHVYKIKGPFVQAEIKNRNNRNYKMDIMRPAVDRYIADRMQPGKMRSYGELGHPDGVEINADRISHYITELAWNGNNCFGVAEVLDTPNGRIVETFLSKGLRLGTSTRGLGTLAPHKNPDGSQDVVEYEYIASDIVIDPSAPDGWVDGIMENKEYIIKDDGVIVECYEKLEKHLSKIPNKDREQYFIKVLENFLKEI